MHDLTWKEFENVDIRVGTITQVEDFPDARKPAFKIWVDCGETIGIKKSSAQITELYSKVDLIGKKVVCVVNFPPKQIGPFVSEVLVTGFPDENGNVVLSIPDKHVSNGKKLF